MKRYKIVSLDNKFIVYIRVGWIEWHVLSWDKNKNHCHGEYCLFDTYEEAEQTIQDWIETLDKKKKETWKWFNKKNIKNKKKFK